MIRRTDRNAYTTNLLKTIYFDHPDWTPCRVELLPATWMKHREGLEDLVLSHPRVFPGYRKGSRDFDHLDNPLYELGRHRDCWGVVWENIHPGMDSIPVEHPLAEWSWWEDYVPPDPLQDDMFGSRDWTAVEQGFQEAKRRGDLATAWPLPHGFMYMKLLYLRGFENLMIDLHRCDPRLAELTALVEAYNLVAVRQCLDLGAEYMSFGDDLGLQTSLPMSPAMWRRHIKPSYARIFEPCVTAGVPIYLHTDGHILEIIPDLIEVGVTVLNPQYRANGLRSLKEIARGRVVLDLDLDRQLFPFATPSEIDDHIGEAHRELHLPQGGLMLYAECGPDVSLENIDAICRSLERICNPPEPRGGLNATDVV
jgi:uroporphyrinogen decarboxylase